MNIVEKLNADLAIANQDASAAQAKVADLNAQIVSIPPALAGVEESEWERVKDFFRSIL